MTELLIIFLIAAACFIYVNLRKSTLGSVQTKPEVYKPEIIQDTSHLKQQLAQSQQQYSSSLHLIGQLQFELKQQKEQLNLITAAKIAGDEKFDKMQFQKKSSEVKTGFLAEVMLPLTEQFPCDPKTLRFLGSPIDFVSFDYEKMEICFVECKTGDSQLNSNQQKVKKMVEEGKVQFKVVRLNEKGIKVK